jgi:hypothetical protein
MAPMTEFEFADLITQDRANALDAADTASNAILDLQDTDTWHKLPIEARRAICAARILLQQAASGLDEAPEGE